MPKDTYIILGGTGLIGSAMCAYFKENGKDVVCIDSKNYGQHKGIKGNVLLNCNGNTYRYKANKDPQWDFQASVVSVKESLFDFQVDLYIYISTVDVYSDISNPANNREDAIINPVALDSYGFHKWLAERLVEKYAKRSVIFRTGTALGEKMKKGPVYDLLSGKELQMSPQSELSMIDTVYIAKATGEIIEKQPQREIYNLTGTGCVKLEELIRQADMAAKFSGSAKNILYKYNINNEKIRRVISIPSSAEIATNFIIKEKTHAVDKK